MADDYDMSYDSDSDSDYEPEVFAAPASYMSEKNMLIISKTATVL